MIVATVFRTFTFEAFTIPTPPWRRACWWATTCS